MYKIFNITRVSFSGTQCRITTNVLSIQYYTLFLSCITRKKLIRSIFHQPYSIFRADWIRLHVFPVQFTHNTWNIRFWGRDTSFVSHWELKHFNAFPLVVKLWPSSGCDMRVVQRPSATNRVASFCSFHLYLGRGRCALVWQFIIVWCGWRHLRNLNIKQEVKVIWQKAPHGGPIPRLGVTPGGRKLYHWIPGVGFPVSVP